MVACHKLVVACQISPEIVAFYGTAQLVQALRQLHVCNRMARYKGYLPRMRRKCAGQMLRGRRAEIYALPVRCP